MLINTQINNKVKSQPPCITRIVVGRINKLFGTDEGGHREPAAYGNALVELAHTTPYSDTHTALGPQQHSDFRLRPTLFCGFDQRKWDKILTESSFSIMHKAMRSVLIATEESVDGVQPVRLRAVEGLFLVEVNAGSGHRVHAG